jgi:lipoprotein-anchoring transpeptidase ErfK/SrfK
MESKFLGRYRLAKTTIFGAIFGLVLSLVLGWGAVISAPAIAQDAILGKMAYLEQGDERWIEVNLSDRHLTAWEGGAAVFSAEVASGTDDDPTYEGIFAVQSIHRIAAMEGKAADGTPYKIDDVPFVLYYDGSYALHGAYWHRDFGAFITHGCVNMQVEQAEWLYHWAYIGSPVVIHW